ncbi:MAG: aconitate hydratase [Deltaproteobacteria bacterium]|jgi:aconitate hydratase|nr:aconitate hydratase [Deltaproteobacteria bacterium]
MGKNLVQKILEAHLKEGELKVGEEVGIRIDQTLTQDATGTMAYLQFEAMGLTEVKTDLSVSYVDHNTVQVGFENADDHAYLQSVAAKYGIVFSRPGNGICHQVHLERFGKPGTTMIGSDSHTPTGGGIGQIAIGAGGLDVAVAMGGGFFYLPAPKVYKVNLTGELKPWITAKDVILEMLETLSTKGNVGVILEYGGPGMATLTVPERATITNMGAEMGVTTSIFPSDDETRKFLKAQGREGDWVELGPDGDATYDRQIDINLSEIEPLTAAPHSPGNIKKVSELAGMKVDQVLIGSCTNSSYKDLVTAAKILKGRKVHPKVSLGVAPGSRQVMQMLAKEGYLADLIESGARILESACGFCIGNSVSPGSGKVSIRTSNRNFEGRSGTKDAQVYLTSCEVAAAAAIEGEFADPRKLGLEYPSIMMPEQYVIDDSMFIFPAPKLKDAVIVRGPNIGEPPRNEKLPQDLKGEVMLKVGDKITTDHIMPAGPRLKYRSNVKKYSTFVFENVDSAFHERCSKNRDSGIHNIIVAGESYGQGSSREHAALCPMYLGVKAVVARSLERIHAANLVNFGIVPLTFKNPADHDVISQGDSLEVVNLRGAIEKGEVVKLMDKTNGKTIECDANLSERQRGIVLAGGLLNYTNSN